jgi:hypothetical protein
MIQQSMGMSEPDEAPKRWHGQGIMAMIQQSMGMSEPDEAPRSWLGQGIMAMIQQGMGMSEPDEAPKGWQGAGMMQRGMVAAGPGPGPSSAGRLTSILFCLILFVIGASGTSNRKASNEGAGMQWTAGTAFGLQRSLNVWKSSAKARPETPTPAPEHPVHGASLLGFQRSTRVRKAAVRVAAEEPSDDQAAKAAAGIIGGLPRGLVRGST